MKRQPRIRIDPSPLAHIRSDERASVPKRLLLKASRQHIDDVRKGLRFFSTKLVDAMRAHDADKLDDIDGFHEAYVAGQEQTAWRRRHRTVNRHHLAEAGGVPADVNLIDVLDFVADCVMSGAAHGNAIRKFDVPPDLLNRALQNTAELLRKQIVVAGRKTKRSARRRRQAVILRSS